MLRALVVAAAVAGFGACTQSSAVRHDESGEALHEETEPHEVATGRIAAVDAQRNVVFVDRANGGRIVLRLTPSTVVTKDGSPASVGEIRQGVPIRAAYEPAHGENWALVVDVSQLGAFPPARPPAGQTH